MKIEIIKKGWLRQKWHFRIVARNGKTLAASENYHNRQDLADTLISLQKDLPNAEIVDLTIKEKPAK
jgi:uncharacterized protein YegP (UPF0339 family)